MALSDIGVPALSLPTPLAPTSRLLPNQLNGDRLDQEKLDMLEQPVSNNGSPNNRGRIFISSSLDINGTAR